MYKGAQSAAVMSASLALAHAGVEMNDLITAATCVSFFVVFQASFLIL